MNVNTYLEMIRGSWYVSESSSACRFVSVTIAPCVCMQLLKTKKEKLDNY